MTEFRWKNCFLNQQKKTEHINKYELLLFTIKALRKNTQLLEENCESFDIQDFSIYENFFINCIKPKFDDFNEKSRLLNSQNLFDNISSKLKVNVPLDISRKDRKELFDIFANSVNLKDLKTANKAYKWLIYGFFSLIVLIISLFLQFNFYFALLAGINFYEIICAYLMYRTFRGKSKSFFLNSFRINTDLCLIQLQKELEELEILLKIPCDPYKNFTYEETYKLFTDAFEVPENFIKICQEKKYIDENYIVTTKYNKYLIQYLKSVRKSEFEDEKFNWQLINHIITFNISKSQKSTYLDKSYKKDSKTGEFYTKDGKKFFEFISSFQK